MNLPTYTIPEPLMQSIVNTLNELPAGRVRPILNALESECAQQDQARAAKVEADKLAALRAELKAEADQAPPAARKKP